MHPQTSLLRHRPATRTTLPHRPRQAYFVLLAIVACAAQAAPAPGQLILYVDADAPGANDGSSWQNAYTDLQPALDRAGATAERPIEIRVAEGVYVPSKRTDADDPRSATFSLIDRVNLLGGYAGFASADPEQRDFDFHASILSGDLAGNDGPDFANYEENVHHVLVAKLRTSTTRLDGFWITGGNANGPYPSIEDGAGLLATSGGPLIANCMFIRNRANNEGAGVYLSGSEARVFNSAFVDNQVRAGTGAAGLSIRSFARAVVTNCVFNRNSSNGPWGDALYLAGGTATITNCTFSANWGPIIGTYAQRTTVSNCVFWGNPAHTTISSYDPDSLAGLTVSYCCIEGGFDGPGNRDVDPLFVDPLGPDGIAGTVDDDLRLRPGSPCIDMGDNFAVGPDTADLDGDGNRLELVSLDAAGRARLVDQFSVDDLGVGERPIVDAGAYEVIADCNANGRPDSEDISTGASMDCNSNAIPDECEADCDGNGRADLCDISDGRSEDCNANGIMDLCELDAGTAADCNANDRLDECDVALGDASDCNDNGILDECEIADDPTIDCDSNGALDACEDPSDCNSNGVLDVCDIFQGTSDDCNENRTPDECDIRQGRSIDCENNGVPNECERNDPRLADDNGNGVPDICEIEVAYVDASAPPGGNGRTWQTAFNDLQLALNLAEATRCELDEIRVARGTYTPSTRWSSVDPRSATFLLRCDTAIYGGFAGAADPQAPRDSDQHPTVLSGDLLHNDTGQPDTQTDNAYHVVSIHGDFPVLKPSPLLDGITITRGVADTERHYGGAGLIVTQAGLTLANCRVTGNRAGPGGLSGAANDRGFGGALYVSFNPEEEIRISDSLFLDNAATTAGGGIYAHYVDLTIEGSTFGRNTATLGGGGAVYIDSGGRVTLDGCTFNENYAEDRGGAIGGDIQDLLTVRDCEFVANRAGAAGAVGVYGGPLLVADSRFEENTAETSGGAIRGPSELTIDTCEFQANRAEENGGAVYMASFHADIVLRRTYFNNNTANNGAAVFTSSYDAALIDGCTFEANFAAREGGAVLNVVGALHVIDSRFKLNQASSGGAIHCYDELDVSNSHFAVNGAINGGALALRDRPSSRMDLSQSTFAGNHADVGGAIWNERGDVAARSCLFEANQASFGGAIAHDGGTLDLINATLIRNEASAVGAGVLLGPGATILSSILWDNREGLGIEPYTDELAQIAAPRGLAIDYSSVQGWTGLYGGAGNTGENPQFLRMEDPDGPFGPLESDLRLASDSPLIDAGDPDYGPELTEADLDGHARVLCGRVDIGTYEFGIGDFNCDRVTELADFAACPACMTGPAGDGDLEAPLFPEGCEAFEFSPDGAIDLQDYAGYQHLALTSE